MILLVVAIVNSSAVEDGRWGFIQQELQVIFNLSFKDVPNLYIKNSKCFFFFCYRVQGLEILYNIITHV